jgi:hypothetical protein
MIATFGCFRQVEASSPISALDASLYWKRYYETHTAQCLALRSLLTIASASLHVIDRQIGSPEYRLSIAYRSPLPGTIQRWPGHDSILSTLIFDIFRRELRENANYVIFSVPLLRKTTKNRFGVLSIFVFPVHFYVISTEFEKSIERSI